jgi:hypothetical protein
MGEVFVEPLGEWGFVSYKVGARMSEVYLENMRFVERKLVTGKSGAEYFAYRIKETVRRKDISDPKLYDLYNKTTNSPVC